MKRTINQTAKRSLKTKKAFALVELLVVIAIIGILFVVLISKVDFATDKAKTAGVQTDFRSYQMAMKMVGMEQQGFTNDMNKLTAQLNKNLDPKLQVAVVDGKLTTEAEDPWGTAYQFTYGEPANTRGEIVVRSAGPDLQYNTDDDIIIVSRYEFGVNGGGVVEATESINPLVLYAAPGLYDPDTGEMTKTWDELIDEGVLVVTGTTLTADTGKIDVIDGALSVKDGITVLGDYAFQNCSGLTNIVIPNSVTRIESGVFENCTSLISIVIPNSVTEMWDGVFYRCTSLTDVTLSSGMLHFESATFMYCISLTSIIIPDGVISIDGFDYCSNLTSIVIPDSVINIHGFSYCSNLTSIVFPDSVTYIGDGIFQDCTRLASVTIKAETPPELGSWAFVRSSLANIYVPASSVDAYKAAPEWSEYASLIKPIQ